MAAGLAVGVTNGLVIARFSIQPFIVTLASLLGARGMALPGSRGNEEAARLAELPIWRIIVSVCAMSGMLAGLAGAILAGLAFSGPPTAALDWELSAIAVVGGALLTGGMGSRRRWRGCC